MTYTIWPTVPTRLVVGMMIFMAGMFAYMLTFNFSICLLAMVRPRSDDSDVVLPDFGPRYDWSAYEQSLLIGAYFYGNVLFSVPDGLFVERLGCAKWAVLWAFALCTVLGFLSPAAAGISFAFMFAVRFMMGAVQGVLYPAYTFLIQHWSPPQELGLFTAGITGANVGTVLTWSVSGVIVELWGWAAAFYVTSGMAAVFTLSWMWLVYDSPARHPRIAATEREHIESACRHDSRCAGGRVQRWPPLWQMAKSAPVWALFLMQFGSAWGGYFALTAVPMFLNEILGFQIYSTGILAGIPHIARTVGALGFGCVVKVLQSRFPNVSLTIWRKVFSIFSHVLPGLLLLPIPFSAAHPYLCIALMSASYGLNGAVTVVTITNYHDLSPNYATTLNSIVNGIGNSAGFLSPLVVAYFTSENNTIAEWHYIFYVGAAVYIVPAVVFAIAGSGSVQSWNEAPPANADPIKDSALSPAGTKCASIC